MIKSSALGLSLAAIFGIAIESGGALCDTVSRPVAVIELFTSQGCSSCPPADKLLTDLAQRPDIIALSFPVTYWDYLGWRDTLAKPENTQRQRNYALARGDGQVYTPQAIVNGVEGCVGSNRSAIESAVRSTSSIVAKDAVTLIVKRETGRLLIETGGAAGDAKHKSGTVWVASVSRTATVPIARGENAGSNVTYTNVVRALTAAGEWQGQPTSFAFPLSALPKDGDMLVVFLQEENLGPIVAAARVEG